VKVTTLTVDCGGTGIKASVLDKTGKVLIDFPYLKTPYPLSPSKLIGIIQDFVKADLRIKRVTVGLPGMIRNGKVVVIPHYINNNGPRSAVDPNLKKAWYGFDMQSILQKRLKIPTLVLNDAEVHAAAVIEGKGLETVLTFGTGLGSAIFSDGNLAPHLEISHKSLIQELYPMIIWDKLYIGGGNAQRISKSALKSFDYKVKIIPNSAGVTGGVKAWDLLG